MAMTFTPPDAAAFERATKSSIIVGASSGMQDIVAARRVRASKFSTEYDDTACSCGVMARMAEDLLRGPVSREDLVHAGALIVAEIERRDRLAGRLSDQGED
jgi:hypothetical protein